MSGGDWIAVAVMAAALVATMILDRVSARRAYDHDADRRSRQRLRRELERLP